MCPTSSCRLCLCYSTEFKKVLDENGHYNDIYEIASIYFDAKLLTSIICLECWDHIETFHIFQQKVLETQNNLDSINGIESIVKLEEVELLQLERKDTDYNGDDIKEDLNTQFTNRVDTQDYNPFTSDDEIPLASWSTKEVNDFEMQEIDKFNTKRLKTEDTEESEDELAEDKGNDKCVQTYGYCKYCPKKIKNMRRHIRNIHPEKLNSKSEHFLSRDKGIGKFKCIQCEKEFRFNSLLRIHMTSNQCVPTYIQCEYCPLKIKKREANMRRHVQIKHPENYDEYNLKCQDKLEKLKGNGKFKCCTCDEEFDRLKELNEHMTLQHPEDNAYHCPYCRRTFVGYTSIPGHVKRDHPTEYDDYLSKCSEPAPEYTGNGKFRCLACDNEYDHLKEISDHMILVHPDEDTYQCPLCPNKFKGKKNIPRHMKKDHPKEFKESTINKNPRRKFELLEDILHNRFNFVVTSDEYNENIPAFLKPQNMINLEYDQFISKWKPDLECNVCQNSFTNYTLLRDHFKQEHPGKRFSIKCCDRKMVSRPLLVEHIMLHLDPDIFKCEICEKPSQSYNALDRHYRGMHGDGRDCPHECLICHKRFISKQKLLRHAGVHITEKTHFCNICDKGFVDKLRLSKHKTNAHNKPKRLCDECGKSFKDINSLKQHLLSHAGIKINRPKPGTVSNSDIKIVYVCSECGKKFANKFYMQQHKKHDHENVVASKFMCNICYKVFKYAQILRDHVASHSAEKPFQCPHCPTLFKQKKNIRRHMQLHHPNEFLEEENLRKRSKEGLSLTVKEIVI